VTAPPTTDRRQSERNVRIAAGLGVGAVLTACVITPSMSTSGPPMCPFHLVTGLPCPGCGLTRSWTSAAHGQVADAFSYNLFGPITFVATIVFAGVVGVLLVRRRPVAGLARVVKHPIVWAVAVIWIVYGVTRVVDRIVGGGLFPDIS
jgi:hypothetical protein